MKVNISIDDVSPHPHSSAIVLDRCFEIIEAFPDAKFTLFVPAAYWRTMHPTESTVKPLQINLFPDFCKKLNDLPRNNFELGYHGFYHGIPGKNDNDEMRYLNKESCNELLDAIFKVVDMAGLKERFSPILRPPAWRMSEGCFDSCLEKGIEVLALSNFFEDYSDDSLNYHGRDSEFKDVVYFTSSPPWKPLKLTDKTEIVYHACEWDKNFLSESMTQDLIKFIHENLDNIEFSFMGEMIDGEI